MYNAKDRCLEIVLGLTNTYLLEAMEWSKGTENRSPKANSIIARIKNCFSMLNPDGTAATEADLDGYRGNFTPDFYPMRYLLKDPLYQQYPIVLSYLLNHVSNAYIRARVKYVEFSVSLGDLSNETIYHYISPDMAFTGTMTLTKRTNIFLKYCRQYAPIADGVFTYRLLMAFPRGKSKLGRLPKDILRKVVVLSGPAYIFGKVETSKFLTALFGAGTIQNWALGLYKALENDCSTNLIVGADIVGDEDGNPFSPFLHKDILAVPLKFQEKNKRFGIRFYAGENVAKNSSVPLDPFHAELQLNFLTHMNIISFEILQLKDIFLYVGPKNVETYCIRIGHGLAFVEGIESADLINTYMPVKRYNELMELHCGSAEANEEHKKWIEALCDYNDTIKDTYHWLSLTGSEFLECKKFLLTEHICFEVCLTSNNTLLSDLYFMEIGSGDGCRLLIHMLASGYYVLLCTDDDGIWPIHACDEHNKHFSVSHEYCKSICMLQDLSQEQLRKMLIKMIDPPGKTALLDRLLSPLETAMNKSFLHPCGL